MLCPSCKTGLVLGEKRKYETLSHHICAPNDPCPEDDTVICPNVECKANKDKVFWAYDGEGPYNSNFHGKSYNWIDGNSIPFDSFHRAISFQCDYHKEDRDWCNRFFMITRKVTYKSNDHGDKVGRQISWALWFKSKPCGYTRYTPGIRMFIYSLKKFYEHRSYCNENLFPAEARAYHENNIVDYLNSADWPRAEWWRKAARWWIRTFHSRLLKEIDVGS